MTLRYEVICNVEIFTMYIIFITEGYTAINSIYISNVSCIGKMQDTFEQLSMFFL